MTRKQADAAFESLRRHASAVTPPAAPADAAELLRAAVLTQLQRDAMVHYITVGPDNLALAYSVLRAGARAFAVARFLAPDRSADPATAQAANRERFAARIIPIVDETDRAEPSDRGRRLVDGFTGRIAAALDRLCAELTPPDAEPATSRAGDLFEAAGIAYLIAQLLESPSRPAAALAG